MEECNPNVEDEDEDPPSTPSLPKNLKTSACTLGILVVPPTRTTSSTSSGFNSAMCKTVSMGISIFRNKSALISSNKSRVNRREYSHPLSCPTPMSPFSSLTSVASHVLFTKDQNVKFTRPISSSVRRSFKSSIDCRTFCTSSLSRTSAREFSSSSLSSFSLDLHCLSASRIVNLTKFSVKSCPPNLLFPAIATVKNIPPSF
mmetsp:Transcript_43183/g.85147  ORF Transcript_43183/g.85147 Transcript_43183/m.85147 type:complete len:202 (-) Transcript_43183:1034-1639(-)